MQGVVGAKLKKARTELRLSQAAFARALGFSSEFISLLEADKRAPSLTTLNKIAAYLKKDIHDFLQEKEGAFNILLRGDALKGPEGLDAASQAVLQRFKRYCDDYLRLERSPPAASSSLPSTANISPERLADEERRRLGLGDEPVRDIFALSRQRLPLPPPSHPRRAKVSGVFIFLEHKGAAFALVNSADHPAARPSPPPTNTATTSRTAARGRSSTTPMFSSTTMSPSTIRGRKFAQTFAACFLMPASKVRAIIEKEFGGRRLTFDQVLYLKRYFGVSFAAMLRKVREMGFVSAAQFEDFIKRDPDRREREVFGARAGERTSAGRPIFSDRYKLLQLEVTKKKRQMINRGK